VTSQITRSFRKHYDALPDEVRKQARVTYLLWKESPYHASLQFKRASQRQPIYSVRVGTGWRALGLLEGATVYWFWIGSHAEYDELLRRL
jgi:hypothetical protein